MLYQSMLSDISAHLTKAANTITTSLKSTVERSQYRSSGLKEVRSIMDELVNTLRSEYYLNNSKQISQAASHNASMSLAIDPDGSKGVFINSEQKNLEQLFEDYLDHQIHPGALETLHEDLTKRIETLRRVGLRHGVARQAQLKIQQLRDLQRSIEGL